MEQILFTKSPGRFSKEKPELKTEEAQIKQKVWSTLPSDLLKINIDPLDSLPNLVARVFPLKWRELTLWR
jgi:hypothetical protein